MPEQSKQQALAASLALPRYSLITFNGERQRHRLCGRIDVD